MRAILFALCLALAACGATQGLKVESPAEHVFALRTGYVAAFLTPADAYASLPDCDANPQPCSDDDVVTALQKADLSAKAALDAAENVVRNHPTLDSAAFIAAAQQALDAGVSILTIYGIGG